MPVQIKVCGINKHLVEVDALGPDYMGYIFWNPSSRNCELADIPPTKAQKVGVFVNEELHIISETAKKYSLNAIQLHGNESPHFCKQVKDLGYKVFKAFKVEADFDFNRCTSYEQVVDMFVFDSPGKLPGGNGVTFSWDRLEAYKGETPYLLSGGINPNNIADAFAFADNHDKCVGVDVNSGYEEKPGVKDLELLKGLFALRK